MTSKVGGARDTIRANDRTPVNPRRSTSVFDTIFSPDDIVKIYDNANIVREGDKGKTHSGHTIIVQSCPNKPLSAANACIQMLVVDLLSEGTQHLLTAQKETLDVRNQTNPEMVREDLENYIISNIGEMKLFDVTANLLPNHQEKMKALGLMIQENNRPACVAISDRMSKLTNSRTIHFVMVDKIADYLGTLCAEIRDPSFKGYYLVKASALEKVMMVADRIIQVSLRPIKEQEPSYELEPESPSTAAFHRANLSGLFVPDSPQEKDGKS